MELAERTLTYTPLEELEVAVHEHFGDDVPSEEDAAEFIRTLPMMDGGISAAIVIALAGLVLQGYQVHTERKRALLGSGGNCPYDGKPAVSINKFTGRFECRNGHTWT